MSPKAWVTLAGVAVAVAVALVIVLIVSGGSDSESTSTTVQPPAGAVSQEFQDCLAEHGVDVPDGPPSGTPPSGGAPPSGGFPPTGSGGGDQAKAFQACSKYLPDDAGAGGFPTPPGG